MQSICIMNMKGGVGKTTAAIGLASAIASYHKVNRRAPRVLLVDCDPSTNLSEFFLQAIRSEKLEFDRTIKDYAETKCDPSSLVYNFTFKRTRGIGGEKDRFYTNMTTSTESETINQDVEGIRVTRECTLSLIAGSADICDVDANQNDFTYLRELLKNLDYDYVIFDMPPEIMNISLPVLLAADHVIIPIEPASHSITGFRKIINQINEIRSVGHNINILGVLFIKVPSNESIAKDTIQQLRDIMGDTGMIFDTIIPRLSAANKSMTLGTVPTVYELVSPYVKSYVSLSNEVVKRLKAFSK